MTTNDWLNNLKPGQEVIIGPNYPFSVATITTIDRLTDTQIIVRNGWRFRRTDGQEVGVSARSTEGPKYLARPTPEALQAVRAEQERKQHLDYLGSIAWWQLSSAALAQIVTLVKAEIEVKEQP